ncbi:MAG: Mrp/NBP35 family ATP-binding protein [Spirochaetia bacterium]|nr:Mrp/NBP35 family ATP-binding protein [Spirochaetia bacterium]
MSTIADLEKVVRDALDKIEHPALKETLLDLGMFDRIEEDAEAFTVHLKSPDNDRKAQISLEAQLRGFLTKASPGKRVKIRFTFDESMKLEEQGNRIRGVKNVIAIGSGKGGVGKSTVSANIAAALHLKGLKVGLLDADIYGPSIGKMFGVPGKLALQGDGKNKIIPFESNGIKIISFAFMLAPEQAVVWRGPMLGKAVEQFLYEVIWGELDVLLIDLPPGTGDVQLSLAQLVDLDGAVIVTTPQNVALQDAARAASMFQQVKIPILGVIENMSEFQCPKCGHVTNIFSKNGGTAMSAKLSVPELGSIPLQKEIMDSGEDGLPITLKDPDGLVAGAYKKIADKILVEVEKFK